MQKTIEKDFIDYLNKKVVDYNFSENKKKIWIEYVLDFKRGKNKVDYILSEVNVGNRENYLDVGCGFGNLLLAFKNYFKNIYGLEIVGERVEWVKKRVPGVKVYCADAKDIPFPDKKFDLITCVDVLEHIPYKAQQIVVSELLRILKPGGFLYIDVPNKFQVKDDHNKLFFSTYLPNKIAKWYVRLFSGAKSFAIVFSRTGCGWMRLLNEGGLVTGIKKHKISKFLPAQRFSFFLSPGCGLT